MLTEQSQEDGSFTAFPIPEHSLSATPSANKTPVRIRPQAVHMNPVDCVREAGDQVVVNTTAEAAARGLCAKMARGEVYVIVFIYSERKIPTSYPN